MKIKQLITNFLRTYKNKVEINVFKDEDTKQLYLCVEPYIYVDGVDRDGFFFYQRRTTRVHYFKIINKHDCIKQSVSLRTPQSCPGDYKELCTIGADFVPYQAASRWFKKELVLV